MESTNSIRIKIALENEVNQPLKTKELFWKQVFSDVELSKGAPLNLENKLKAKFGKTLTDKLSQKFSQSIREIEGLYYSHLKNVYFDEPFHFLFHRKNSEDLDITEYFNSITKLQELKNEYFKNNVEYQKLLYKSIIASQIEFKIENIYYSSLSFNLITEQVDKVSEVFDNNFEYFKTFLDIYLPETFRQCISVYDDDKLPLSISCEFTDAYKKQFEQKPNNQIIEQRKMNSTKESNKPENDKSDKARWLWIISNLSLVLPVTLSLIVMYVAFNRVERLNEETRTNFEKIQVANDSLINRYKGLIDYQEKTYKNLIEENKPQKTK